MKPIYQFEVHTRTKMYTIMAAYFVADNSGVIFFDEQDRGMGFAPNSNLNFVRLSPPKPIDWTEMMRDDSRNIPSAKAIFDR